MNLCMLFQPSQANSQEPHDQSRPAQNNRNLQNHQEHSGNDFAHVKDIGTLADRTVDTLHMLFHQRTWVQGVKNTITDNERRMTCEN